MGWLLDHGASPGALASHSEPRCVDLPRAVKTPLDFAAIVAGWAPEGSASFFYFMENVHVDPARFHETARLLLEKGAELTPRAAVALGDREAVLRLHRQGRLPNEIHIFRGGLLGIAVRVNRPNTLATLLDLGLDPDETDDGGGSSGMPLWFASMCGRHEMAELLLARVRSDIRRSPIGGLFLTSRLTTFPGEPNQRFRIPVGQDLIAFLRIVVPADFILLEKANSIDPAERSH